VSTPVPSGYNQDISPFMGSSELWARLASGDTAGAMNLLASEWGHMASTDPASTAWERMKPDGTVDGGGTSWAHGWSAGSTSGLSQYVLGVSPVDPGYQTWLVQPHPGSLAWAEGQAPTPHGPVTVDWGRRAGDGEFAMHVSAPAGTSGEIAVPTYGRAVTVEVNGRLVWNGRSGSGYGAHSDGSYVYLAGVAGGSYDIVSHPAGPPARTLSVTAQVGTPASASQPGTVTVTVTGQAPETLTGQVTLSGPGGWSAEPVPFTVDGRGGPASTVVSLKVTMPASAAGPPAGLTVAASAGGLTARTGIQMIPFGAWPSGTTATASSYHSPNTVNGQVRTYVPGNAIDGDLTTFWNDANPATYPAVLTVTSPTAVTLPGVAFASSADGVPADFTVSTWNGSAWVQQAKITGNGRVDRWIPFGAPVSTTQVQITVTQDQPAYAGEFTRVTELAP
jgi:hypothetical protein